MNTLSSLASSRFLPQKMSDVLAAANTSTPSRLPKLQTIEQASNDDVVSLSDAGLALAKRANDLGSATIDMAQSLINNFAKQLFGDASKDMKISFDSASISAMAGYSAAVQHSSGPNGSSDATAMSVQEASDFIGKGQITTADGHVYNFEVEVHYQAMAEASASSWTHNGNNSEIKNEGGLQFNQHASTQDHRYHADTAQIPVTTAQTAADLPSPASQDLRAHFPGSIQDLFSLLDDGKLTMAFKLPITGVGNQAQRNGNLTLRLLDLLTSPTAQSKKLNNVYGDDAKLKPISLETKPVSPDAVVSKDKIPESMHSAYSLTA